MERLLLMFAYPKTVTIEEQGPRDGLQNEKKIVSTKYKLELIQAAVAAGIKKVQVTAFVNPKRIPQMADAEKVCAGLKRRSDVVFSALALNPKGVARAAEAGLAHLTASISVSDTHSRKNSGTSLAEARIGFAEMIKIGKRCGLSIRGGLQCVFGCRFEGKIDPSVTYDLVKQQLDLGIDELELADSTGMADPRAIQEICGQIATEACGKPVYLHLHDTEGKGLANALAALQVGINHFDTAFGGMGGCPFIRGASGNMATEDLVFMFGQMGIATGIDIDQVAMISRSLETYFGKRFSGKMHRLLGRNDIQIAR